LIQGNPPGTQIAQVDPGGAVHVEYSFNDRGRGDHIIAVICASKNYPSAVGCRFAAVVSQKRSAVSIRTTTEQVVRAEAHVPTG
jgi:hypothetical protein